MNFKFKKKEKKLAYNIIKRKRSCHNCCIHLGAHVGLGSKRGLKRFVQRPQSCFACELVNEEFPLSVDSPFIYSCACAGGSTARGEGGHRSAAHMGNSVKSKRFVPWEQRG